MTGGDIELGRSRILVGDVLDRLADLDAGSVHCVVTSPPYWGLRDYDADGQIGLEDTPEEHTARLVAVFDAVARVLRPDGTAWVNYGDAYASQGSTLKPKDLMGLPWRVAFALQAAGWYLRSEIIWHKPNPMPESCTDRPTKSHEQIFLLAHPESGGRYYYDADAVREKQAESTGPRRCRADRRQKEGWSEAYHGNPPAGLQRTKYTEGGRNLRDVWTIPTQAVSEAHFATFPERLIENPIKAGTSQHGACSECGAPWRRVVEASGGTIGASWHEHDDDLGKGAGQDGSERVRAMMNGTYQRKTTGWDPTCDHADAPVVPCVVLDPFAGSGTTLLVANRLGCHAVGVELNPEYAEIARRRVGAEATQSRLF